MAETPTPTPATPDLSAQLAQLTDVVGKLATSQATVLEAVGKIASSAATPAPAAKEGKPEPITGDSIQKMVADTVANAFKAQQTSQQTTAQRDAFIKANAAGLPPYALNQLGADPTKWADEVKTIRTETQDWAKANNITVPNVGGPTAAGGGTPASAAIDRSKQSPVANIIEGLKTSTPQGPQALQQAAAAQQAAS